MARIAANGKARLLDLRALGASLPMPPQRAPAAPVFVLGAAGDAIVDEARGAFGVLLRLHCVTLCMHCFCRAELARRCHSSAPAAPQEGVRETARECGAAAAPLLLPGLGHDIMLDARWRTAADALQSWLDTLPMPAA
jgi:hypothetical protein